MAVAEPGCFHRGGQGGASNQPGVAQKSTLFQYKNVADYKVLDNWDICKLLYQVILSEYGNVCIIPHLQVF